MILAYDGVVPKVHESAFVAANAQLIGDVEVGADASIWYNVVLRGDVNFIRVGARTNIQDGTIVHVVSEREAGGAYSGQKGYPTLIGDDVLIGHAAIVHGCELHDRAFVGMGAIVMDGCVIEEGGMIAAGAMLTPGKIIGQRELWVGRPARLLRSLSDDELAGQRAGVEIYVDLGRRHREALRKDPRLQEEQR
jgi:gamma-carbonic anhydrase